MSGRALTSERNLKGKISSFFFSCFVASWGGFIFGFDLAIAGGVSTNIHFMKKFFPSIHKIGIGDESFNPYCTFRYLRLHHVIFPYFAILLVSPFASTIRRRLGRRILVLVAGLIFFTGATISASAMSFSTLVSGRILLGVGFGFIDQCRDAFNIFFQLMFSLGVFAANLVTFGIDMINADWGWRLSLALAAIPGGLIIIGSCILSDTLDSTIEYNNSEVPEMEYPWTTILQTKYTPHLFFVTFIPCLQAFAGANALVFFCPILLKIIGLGNSTPLFTSIISFANVLATMVSVHLINNKGRRWLLIEGGIQMLIFQLLLGILVPVKFWLDGVETIGSWYAFGVVVCICGYVVGFAWSWGPLGWLVPSEICPPEIHSMARKISISCFLVFSAGSAQTFMIFLCEMSFGFFVFHAALLSYIIFFALCELPETKDVSIEEMWVLLKRFKHWGMYIPDDLVIEMGHY